MRGHYAKVKPTKRYTFTQVSLAEQDERLLRSVKKANSRVTAPRPTVSVPEPDQLFGSKFDLEEEKEEEPVYEFRLQPSMRRQSDTLFASALQSQDIMRSTVFLRRQIEN